MNLLHSLKTLPVATKEQLLLNRVHDNKSLNIGVVEEAAKLLKESLGLTIFGFDVVVSISSRMVCAISSQYSYKQSNFVPLEV